MDVQLNQIFDIDGEPIPFARIEIYESGPNGKHLASLQANEDGKPPPIVVSADALRVVITTPEPERFIVKTYDDLT